MTVASPGPSVRPSKQCRRKRENKASLVVACLLSSPPGAEKQRTLLRKNEFSVPDSTERLLVLYGNESWSVLRPVLVPDKNAGVDATALALSDRKVKKKVHGFGVLSTLAPDTAARPQSEPSSEPVDSHPILDSCWPMTRTSKDPVQPRHPDTFNHTYSTPKPTAHPHLQHTNTYSTPTPTVHHTYSTPTAHLLVLATSISPRVHDNQRGAALTPGSVTQPVRTGPHGTAQSRAANGLPDLRHFPPSSGAARSACGTAEKRHARTPPPSSHPQHHRCRLVVACLPFSAQWLLLPESFSIGPSVATGDDANGRTKSEPSRRRRGQQLTTLDLLAASFGSRLTAVQVCLSGHVLACHAYRRPHVTVTARFVFLASPDYHYLDHLDRVLVLFLVYSFLATCTLRLLTVFVTVLCRRFAPLTAAPSPSLLLPSSLSP
ncbi:hypothetical protein RJ55_02884 [Drechmeria coniospora]|nr:hypothetical protein RJ55_02884 [Drechmeria coniospora]